MKLKKRKKQFKLLSTLMPLAIGIGISSSAYADNSFVSNANLPTDVKETCTADIASWFGGNVTANGWVEPANSLNKVFGEFATNSRCDFYKWGAQMFLWLTSGQEFKHVFNTAPTFFDVSIKDENGKRTFIAQDGPMMLGVRKSKTNEEIELGQAGGLDALISQDESIVYYSLHANDVFALYTTGQKKNTFGTSLPDFPNTKNDLSKVVDFAREWGYPIYDPEALAMELKASWIDASTLSDDEKQNYVLTSAIVPIFDRNTSANTNGVEQWSIIGNQPKTLALVGMHIVGTVKDHPEMVWSTIEHVNNAPDNTYSYTNTSNQTKSVSYNSSGNWNFSKSTLTHPPASITASAKVSTYTPTGDVSSPECVGKNPLANECLVSTSNVSNGGKIAPIDIFRVDPWGNNQGTNPTKLTAAIENNTDLISINKSVLSQLITGDIRGNYIQTGGVWTAEGTIPPNGTDSTLRGSLNLANTTMETFFQLQNTYFNPQNCFGCHSYDPKTQKPTDISHIFEDMQPLEPSFIQKKTK